MGDVNHQERQDLDGLWGTARFKLSPDEERRICSEILIGLDTMSDEMLRKVYEVKSWLFPWAINVRIDAMKELLRSERKPLAVAIATPIIDDKTHIRLLGDAMLCLLANADAVDEEAIERIASENWNPRTRESARALLHTKPALRAALGEALCPRQPPLEGQLTYRIENLEGIEALAQLFRGSGDPELYCGILFKLKAATPPEVLRIALECPDMKVRRAAVELVPDVLPDEAFDKAMANLSSSSPEVRSSALFKLAEMGDARAIPAMEELLDDPDPYHPRHNPHPVSDAAQAALEKLRKKLGAPTKNHT